MRYDPCQAASPQPRPGTRAKFERHGDQAGSAGLGFYRTPQPEARPATDPVAIARVVRLFEEYATGDVAYLELAARHGLAEGHVRSILTDRIYSGWSVRQRRSADQVLVPAPLARRSAREW